MIAALREYLADELECDVLDGPAGGDDVAVRDHLLTFTFRDETYVVIVSADVLADPPRDLACFLDAGDDDASLADALMVADDRRVVIRKDGFSVA